MVASLKPFARTRNPLYLSSDITFQNVLWGDYIYVNPSQNIANGGALVHIEASTTDPATTTAGRYTFYGRYVGWNAIDHREPLATTILTSRLLLESTRTTTGASPSQTDRTAVSPVAATSRSR